MITMAEYIKNGTYGKISLKAITPPKYKCIDKELELKTNGTATEIWFYKNFCSGKYKFLPILKSIKVLNNNIVIRTKYCGKTIDIKKSELSFEDKIKYLPSVFIQICGIINWLNDNFLIHCDIKPANICWGCKEEPKLVLIDFGFVIPYKKIKRRHYGTQSFLHPTYYNSEIHDSDYDIFSSGITLLTWLTNEYLDENVLKDIISDEELINIFNNDYKLTDNINNLKKNNLYDDKVDEIIKHIYTMIKLDKNERNKILSLNLIEIAKKFNIKTKNIYTKNRIKIDKTNQKYKKYNTEYKKNKKISTIIKRSITHNNIINDEISPDDLIKYYEDNNFNIIIDHKYL